jgi:hypothetical protein
MANESKITHKGKVTLGANTVLGMGEWTWSGFSAELAEDIEFGDDYDDYVYGMINCGTVTFSGNYKKDDTTGQNVLKSAMLNKSNVGDLRLYVDETSYYTPNTTTSAGGGLPAETPVGHVKVQTVETSFPKGKAALGTISFTAQVCVAPLRLI